MGESVAREFERFVAAERRAGRIGALPGPMREGQVFDTVFVEAAKLAEFARVAARRGAGLLRPSARSEIVWVEGANQLAIDIAKLDVRVADGVIRVMIPVRSDQTGSVPIEVLFVVSSASEPAGLYAAASKKPSGPERSSTPGARRWSRLRGNVCSASSPASPPLPARTRAATCSCRWNSSPMRAASRSCRWHATVSPDRAP
jgi:hypothetical protein